MKSSVQTQEGKNSNFSFLFCLEKGHEWLLFVRTKLPQSLSLLEMEFWKTFVISNNLQIQQRLDLGLRCGPINKLGLYMMLG